MDPQNPNRLQHLPAAQDRPRPDGPQSATNVVDGDGEGDGEALYVTLAPREGVVEGLVVDEGVGDDVGVVLQEPYPTWHPSGQQYSTLDPQNPKRLQHKPAPQDRPSPDGPHSVTRVCVAVGEAEELTLALGLMDGCGVRVADAVDVEDGVGDGCEDGDGVGARLGDGVVLQDP